MLHTAFTRPATPPANTVTAPLISGLVAGTMVDTQRGWIPAEDLRLGDRLQTFDGGACCVLALNRNWTAAHSHVIRVPGGVLDTCTDLTLLPGQLVLIDTMGDTLLPDAALVLIPATALTGWRGTVRMTINDPIEITTPMFAAEEAIFANTGAMVRCPPVTHRADQPIVSDFTRLDLLQAWALLARLDGGPNATAHRVAA